MKTITASVRILNDGNKPASGITVNLEMYVLKSNRWLRVGTGKTDVKGNWNVSVARNTPNEVYAPMLRLIEPGNPSPKVLAQHAYLKYDAAKGILAADFGVVERLENETYKLTATTSQFARSTLYVAAQADQPPEVRTRVAARLNIAGATVPRVSTTASPVKANEAELIKLRTSETQLKDAIASKEALISARDLELSKVRTSETELKRTITTKDQLISAKEAELSQVRTSETELKRTLTTKEQLISTRDQELKQAKLQITDLNKTLQERLKEMERLKKQREAATGEAPATPLSTIATNIGSEVDNANKTLQSRNLPYQFGRINLSLAGAVAEDGQSIALARLSDAAKEKALSNVKLELLPTKGQADLRDAVTVPDVSGLTETVVRRLLNSVGLKLEVVSKSLGEKSGIPVGQSIQQSPKAGANAARNGTVLVVFAAP